MIDKNPLQENSNKQPLAGLFYIPTLFTHKFKKGHFTHRLKTPVFPIRPGLGAFGPSARS